MHDFYHLMAAGQPCDEVLQSLAVTTLEQQKQAAAAVTDEQISWVLSFSERTVSGAGVKNSLIKGAFLYAVSLIEDAPHRRELIDALYDDLGLSRSAGHRCIQMWLAFGPHLIAEPELQTCFRDSSLAVLSETRTPQAAREEALQLAREGEKITIKRAQALQSKLGMLPELSVAAEGPQEAAPVHASKKRGRKTHKWLFVGETARIEVIPTGSGAITDCEPVIRDLEAAIDQLRSSGASQQVA